MSNNFRSDAQKCIYQCQNIAECWKELNDHVNALKNNAEVLKRQGIDSREIDKLVQRVEADLRDVHIMILGD